MAYLDDRLKQYNINAKDNTIRLICRDYPPQNLNFFNKINKDDIQINYYTPSGNLVQYDKNKKLTDFYRVRFKEPDPKTGKYSQPFKSGTFPFITPGIISKFKAGTEIETLFIVEGEFKAFVGNLNGLDIISISGIHSFIATDDVDLHEFIKELIAKCKIKALVLLFDADCLSVTFDAEKDLYKRPNLFYSAVKKFKELTRPYNIDVYFSHILQKWEKEAKGLDDLLIHIDCDKSKLLKELKSFSVGKKREYVNCLAISENSIFELRKYFGLESVDTFYNKYQSVIQDRTFIYGNTKYRHNGEQLKVIWYGEAGNYLRVGINYYKKCVYVNKHKDYETSLNDWNIGEISRDYNNNKDFIKQIPKFDMFCNIPDNTEGYRKIHVLDSLGITSKLFNRYQELKHEIKEGDWSTIETFLKHIFACENLSGESLYEFGLDYIQILYSNPLQRLPVLCPVSKSKNTGKSTFLEFLRLIFKENCTILDNERFTGKFTSHFIDKLVIGIDESFIPVEQKLMKERIKNFSTAQKMWLEAKGKPAQEIDYFGKLILASNDETNFMQIDDDENRFAVIKIEKLTTDDPMILNKMKNEIPFFLYFIKNRTLHYPVNKSRFSFETSVYKTKALQKVQERMQSKVMTEISEFLKECFTKFGFLTLEYTPEDIANEINVNATYKFDKNKIRDCLKYEMNLRPEKFKKYKIHVLVWDQFHEKFNTEVKEIKAGRPFMFLAEDYTEEGNNTEFIAENTVTDEPIVRISREKIEDVF
jgi:hypothetical protein